MVNLIIIARTLIVTSLRCSLWPALLLLLLLGSVRAQTFTSSATDKTTPTGFAPGAPAGAYALSGFDNINLFNGNLNFRLPLLQIGGRGAAGHTIMLAINAKRWRVRRSSFFHLGEETNVSWTPTANQWNGLEVGYGPGVMVGRQIGVEKWEPNVCNVSPGIYKFTLTKLTFTMPDGAEYEFRDQISGGKPQDVPRLPACSNPSLPGASRGTVFVTADGTAATFISDIAINDKNLISTNGNWLIYPSGYLMMRDGTRYRIDVGMVSWMRDRHGNILSFSYDGNNRLDTVTDSLNRQVTISYDYADAAPYGLCDRITFTGFGGATRIVRVSHDNLINTLRSDYSIQTYSLLFPQLNGANNIQPNTYNPSDRVSSVWLPNDSSTNSPNDKKRYQFFYNPYGEVARVVLPTGGAIEYDYTTSSGVRSDLSVFNTEYQIYRRVIERRTLADAVTLEGKTLYPITASGDFTGVVNHQNPNGISLGQEIHSFSGDAAASLFAPLSNAIYSSWGEGKETQSIMLAGDGTTPIHSEVPNWELRAPIPWLSWWNSQFRGATYPAGDNPDNDARITETVMTLLDVSPNQVSRQSFGYDAYNNKTEISEYDYGAGSPSVLIRRTHTDYITGGYDTISGGTNNPNPSTTIHIRSLPMLQQVFDSGGVLRAQTDYEYDGNPLGGLENYSGANIPGLVGRDGLTQAQGYNPAGDLARGNPTKVTRWLLASIGPVTQDTPLYSYSRYDVLGNVVKVRDSNGNDTTLNYSDSFSSSFTANTFAFLTSTASPTPGTAYGGGVPLINSSIYDFQSGKATSTTDPNGKVTSVEYNDSLDRLTKIIRPSGGGDTTYQYGDVIGNLYLRTLTKQSASVSLEDYSTFDGLGRAKRSAHFEGQSGYSVGETQYDALGRVNQVSNPFFATSYSAGAGSAWTTTAYDSLSRVTRVTTPDGAHVDTAYLGNKVTVTDQAGKSRSSITDGLGRLTQVNEDPNGALNYQTNYTYDVLGNLIRVRQGGFPTSNSPDPTVQFRRFYYDSLSRLIYANNPEQDATIAFNPPNEAGTMWTMKYVYDNNGNLTSRTDARIVTATYGYDALNRNTTVSYSDGTAAVSRYYDISTTGDGGGTFTNGKGRLRRVDSLNLNPGTTQHAYSRMVIDGYDALGRLTSQKQGLGNSSDNYTYYLASRTYDLASHVLTQTYPSFSNVTYSYNSAGRLINFDGSLANSGYVDFASEFKYNEAGQMTRETFGTTGTTIYHGIGYNNRFQMVEANVGNDFADSQSWTRGRLRFFYSDQAITTDNPYYDGAGVNGPAANNGNVLRQEHRVPTSVTSGAGNAPSVINSYAIPMRDDYTYDSINRLAQVKGYQQPQGSSTFTQIYQQTYTYDKFGNRKLYLNTNDPSETTWGTGINGTFSNQIWEPDKKTNRLVGVTYDPTGNMIKDVYSARADTKVYDAENRMTKSVGGGNTNYYVYDGDGKRVRRIVGGSGGGEYWQVYGIDGELLAEYKLVSGSPVLQKEYGYRNGQLLVIGEPGLVKWLIADHLGTPRIIVDSTGVLAGVTRHDYLPFGEELMVGMGNGSIRTGTGGMGYAADTVRQKFVENERDTETGLDFFGARYFAPTQGRFTSGDPLLASGRTVQPQSWNRYTYALNNPLRYIDPDGEDYKDLSENQRKLIDDWAMRQNEANKTDLSAKDIYNALSESQRSTYEGVTNALENTTIIGADGTKMNALDTIQRVNVIAGEIEGMGGADQFRLFVTLKEGAKEFIEGAKNFYSVPGHGDEYPDSRQLKGGEPSPQFSMSRKERKADIDVDYESKKVLTNLFTGFKHVRPPNSDVRASDHFEKHNKRFASQSGQKPLVKRYEPKPPK